MDFDSNPYQPPQANVDGGGATTEYWRDGKKTLHIERGANLPARCVKCNAPAVTPIRSRKLYWHHWGYYFLILLRFVPYVIVALIVRQKFVVSAGLCQQHNAARKKKLLAAWLLLAISLIGSWYSIRVEDGAGILVALLALLGALVLAVMSSRIVYAVEITPHYARLKGFGEPFLKSIPPRVKYAGFAPPADDLTTRESRRFR